ncbi:MAG: phosphotransferase family protein [Salinisphaera sp.]|nr:phosphotransferase family protein [Salinisphaera sp.]
MRDLTLPFFDSLYDQEYRFPSGTQHGIWINQYGYGAAWGSAAACCCPALADAYAYARFMRIGDGPDHVHLGGRHAQALCTRVNGHVNGNGQASFAASVQDAVRRFVPGAVIGDLRRLPGGASQQTWSFMVASSGERLILRRSSGWQREENPSVPFLRLANEAQLLQQVAANSVPVPTVRYVLQPRDGLGEGYFMAHVAGEALPQRILGQPEFEQARARLARQCGAALARIHAVSLSSLDFLRRSDPEAVIRRGYEGHRANGQARPVFELAFQWLRGHLPQPQEPALVHGDFRNGNLMVNTDGLTAVLDWELAYIGDPMADLSWLCVNSWRFGHIDNPVGGFGSREDLIAGYEAAGGRPVDRQALMFWEIHGSLRWGLICQDMTRAYLGGADRSVERAAIGRRTSETEIDLMRLLGEQV